MNALAVRGAKFVRRRTRRGPQSEETYARLSPSQRHIEQENSRSQSTDWRRGTLRAGPLVRVSPSGLGSWRSKAAKAAITSGESCPASGLR